MIQKFNVIGLVLMVLLALYWRTVEGGRMMEYFCLMVASINLLAVAVGLWVHRKS